MLLGRFFLWAAPGVLAVALSAQTLPQNSVEEEPLVRQMARDFLQDQKAILTSPAHIKKRDALWLAPLAGAVVALMVTDNHSASALPNTRDQRAVGGLISNAGLGALGAAAGGLFLAGHFSGNERARETGFLSAEAAAEAELTGEIIKLAFERRRPYPGTVDGDFWAHGSSFPSGHALAAWSVATVVASEYRDRPALEIGAYGLAALTSLARFPAQKHFLSDVLVGSVAGYLIGRHVYNAHHNQEHHLSVAPIASVQGRTYGLALAWTW